jgi:TonB-dependent starch-binding outer membrane protein SusC
MHFRTTALLSFDKLRTTGQRIETKKLLLAMKLTAIILLTACIAASATGFGQKISLSERNVSLAEVFKKIERQTNYTFAYTGSQLKEAKKVTVEISNGTIEEVLNLCFKDQPFTYEIIERTIVIKQKEKSPNADATNVDVNSLIDVSGKVTDTEGNPLAGATVKVKGSDKLTTTNNAGVFVLKGVDNDAVLEISFIGYQSYTVAVNSKSSITAALKLNVITNPEVIINKGPYTEKQKTSVSNVVKVTAAEIEKQPVQNVVLALQARVPGLFITQGSGNAGGNMQVRIQGQNSMRNGSDPLYIIDGVPIDAVLPSTGIDGPLGNGMYAGYIGSQGNPLNYLNPLDIESVEVLKDADATAIYGSRAANGAILITTKKGKAGAMKFDLNAETGWGRMTRRVDMMNTRQYLDMRYEAFKNDGIDWTKPNVSANDLKIWDTTRYTNWQDELFGGTAKYSNINASVSGGSATMRYLVSGTYHKETTIWPLPTDFADKKAALHFNLNASSSNQKLRMQFSGNYMFDNNQLPSEDMTRVALLKEPNAPPLLNADGSINWATDANGNSTLNGSNIMTLQYTRYVNKTHNLVSSLKLDYTILPGLDIGSSFGYNYSQTNDFAPSPLIAVEPARRPTAQRSAAFGDRNLQSWIIEPLVNYRTNVKKGTLDLLAGSTFQNKNAEAKYISAQGQVSDEMLSNISAAAQVFSGPSTNTNYKYTAVFGRANYNWEDKYILSMNVRRDGSTRFGADNRFHNFGSVGAAWLFSNETFFKSRFHFISFGKLRGNYGTTGSDQIGDNQYISLYNFTTASAPYQGIVSLVPAGLPNPNLQWEETRKFQAGIDLGFWQDRLTLSANYVRNRSSNQLLGYPLPNQAGITTYLVNFPATVQNQNWEFMVTGKIMQKKNLTWTSSVNLTVPKNKLIEFPGLSDSNYFWKVGYPIDASSQFHWLGVAEGTGEYLYADANGHSTFSPGGEDLSVRTSKYPKFYGGFQNSIAYKSIQLDFIFQFVEQNGYNDIAYSNGLLFYPGMFIPGASNQAVTVLDHWQKPGDHASVGKYSTYEVPYIITSDRRFTSVNFISLKNVSLAWDLPKSWTDKAHFRSFRIYIHAQNLITLSNYKGLNPETQSMTSLPPLQVWTVGLQLGL